ncbi:MAG: methyltransferase domain-containing protein [Clostridia bacterium]|nr:methyltransferase domain-containing protein [Clostridia bacterium]
MISNISYLLKCPVCGAAMQTDPDGRVCRCVGARVHCYDVSRSGYLNLTSPGDGAGDLKAAVKARTLFLSNGYYEPLSDEINGILKDLDAKTVLDAGCGEGYYTNRMGTERRVLGVDLSRAGIDAAAKSAKQSGSGAAFAVGSLFKLPVSDRTFDAITNLFAPCAEAEFLRVLKPTGKLLLVGAGERHLLGLKELIYDNPYLNPGRADLPTTMQLLEHRRLTYSINVKGREQIAALFSMTPYYWRTSNVDRHKLDAAETLETEVDFDIFLYGKGQSK